MELNTASAVVSLAKQLEEEGIKLYEDLAQRVTKDREIWLSFAKENRRNVIQIERAYYGVITDAIEGCFAFNMNADEYASKTRLKERASYSDVLSQALEMEERTIRFYSDAAEQSASLLADVPRVFTMVAKKRGDRCSKLKSLLVNNG